MSTPEHPQEPETITVYVINGTATSQGNGPGSADCLRRRRSDHMRGWRPR